MIGIATCNDTSTDSPSQENKIAEQFSAWDGSHHNLTKMVKKTMHDSTSFKHIETHHWADMDYIIVLMTYSETNLYGATVQNAIKAKVDHNGQVLELLE